MGSIQVNRVLVMAELDIEGEIPADLQDRVFAALEPIGAAGLAVEIQRTGRQLWRPAPPAAAAELPAPPDPDDH